MQRTWICAWLLVLAAPVMAHDSWIDLDRTASAERMPSAFSALRLSTGHHFPRPEHGSAASRLAVAELKINDAWLPLIVGEAKPHWLPLSAATGNAEFAAIRVSLHPQLISLDPAQVESYLQELGDAPEVAARHAEQTRWRERFSKHPKALLRLRAGSPSPLATEVQGLPFELVPRSDPTARRAGQELEVCAYADGKAHTRAYIGLVEADGQASWQWSDAHGCVLVRPASADGFLLRSVLLRAVESEELEWESHFASLTVLRATPPVHP